MAALTPDELMRRVLLGHILDWRKKLEELDAEAAARVVKILTSGDRFIRNAIQEQLPELLKPDLTQANIALWTQEITEPIADELINTLTDAWAVSAIESIRAYNDILSFQGKAKNVALLPTTMEQVTALAATSPFGQFSLAHMVKTVFNDGVTAPVIESIDKGMSAGWGYEKIVKTTIKDALETGAVISRRDAITLSRSYVQQASVNAQLATYQLNSDVIKGLEWTAILDNRVCMKCAALDGTKYLWEEKRPKMIAHPRCRCVWLPWVKSYRDIGLDLDDLEEAARPYVIRENGNVDTGGRKILYAGTTKENYGGWWKTLPYDQQIKSVGPIRTKLLNEGEISWDNLVNKKTGRIHTLKELGFSEEGKKL